MKKNYSKPDLYFESFELTANIANCSHLDFGKANSADINTCSFSFYGVGDVFNNGMCVYNTQNGGLEMFCYHTAPTAALFNS